MRFYLESIKYIGRFQNGVNRRRSAKGFTMAEVLLSSAVMLGAVSVAGIGVTNLLTNNYKANADSQIRNSLNRTLEFMSNEVKRARIIAGSTGEIVSDHVPEGAQAVLAFQIPDPNNPNQPIGEQIVYYLKASESRQVGPKVLWRYGPSFDQNGNYVNPNNTGAWIATPMADTIADETNNDDRRDCDPFRKGTLSGWNRIPEDSEQVQGVYSCVQEGGKQVVLNANAQLQTTANDLADYSVSTKVATRATNAPFFLSAVATPSSSDPAPFKDDIKNPNVPVTTVPSTVTTDLLTPCPGSCRVDIKEPSAPSDRVDGTAAFSPTTTATVDAVANRQILVWFGSYSNLYPSGRSQTVTLYTKGDSITQTGVPNVSLSEDQVLIVIQPTGQTPYVALVTITPN